MKKILFSLTLLSGLCCAGNFTHNTPYQICFVPGQDCAGLVVEAMNGAKLSIGVQAYHLTNKKIIAALGRAKDRGVSIKVILDKGGAKEGLPLLAVGIPVWIDHKKAIAHNKVAIIDDSSFITGSFNFTESAQKRNVENLIWIKDPEGSAKYKENFVNRLEVSRPLIHVP